MRIPVITGTVQEPYKILDSICAHSVGRTVKTFDFETEVDNLFKTVRDDLRSACRRLGGNAVINCTFEVRNRPFHSRSPFGGAEIYAHGTAVLSEKSYDNPLEDSSEKIHSLSIDHTDCVNCPICKAKLRLDSYELKMRCFKCTNCSNKVFFKTGIRHDGGVS